MSKPRQTKVIAMLLCSMMLTLALAPAVRAEVPSIQVSPLKYQDTLIGQTSKLGFVDVSNPSDTTLTLHSSVEAFRQINLDGDLQFYQDDAVAAGIIVSATDFEIGPREAIRVAFTINPQKLPKGGVYAAIFFQTVAKSTNLGGTVISQSARAGTLLILDNGGAGQKTGIIKQLDAGWLQWGTGLSGVIKYANVGQAPAAIAYNPTLSIRATWWGGRSYSSGPLVFPGNTRQFSFDKPGSYIGIIPLVFSDNDTGHQTVRLVLAVTGFWRVIVMLGLAIIILGAAIRLRRRKRNIA